MTSRTSAEGRSDRGCRVVRLPGLTDYLTALEWQRELGRARARGALDDDVLILLEHPHVITLGRNSSGSHLLASLPDLGARGVAVHEIERGGDVTYHGPGQLVGYPIIHLERHVKDLHWYLRQVEEVLVRTLRSFGVEGRAVPGYTGVWVGNRKIASIGVHVSRWVTWHGFALNVSTDLSYFDLIVPCGIPAVEMTSVERETGRAVDTAAVAERLVQSFGAVFDLTVDHRSPDDLVGYMSEAR